MRVGNNAYDNGGHGDEDDNNDTMMMMMIRMMMVSNDQINKLQCRIWQTWSF